MTADNSFREAQLALFRSSALKQQKWRALTGAVGQVAPTAKALDLGSDNGIISWMFRSRGGNWTSADLGTAAAGMIQRMVGDSVFCLDGSDLPFASESFDVIVVVDLLEHVDDDRRLLREIARCLRPGGKLVLNVPHRKRAALLPPFRHALGLTDEWHGHLRPGYTAAELPALLSPALRMTSARTYSRFFSHLLDTALTWTFMRGAAGRAVRTPKGMLVSGSDVRGASGRAFRLLAPVMRAFVALDASIPWSKGYMLVVTADKQIADDHSE